MSDGREIPWQSAVCEMSTVFLVILFILHKMVESAIAVAIDRDNESSKIQDSRWAYITIPLALISVAHLAYTILVFRKCRALNNKDSTPMRTRVGSWDIVVKNILMGQHCAPVLDQVSSPSQHHLGPTATFVPAFHALEFRVHRRYCRDKFRAYH